MKVDGGCFQKKLNFFTIVQIIWSHTIAFYASSYCIYRDIKLLMFVFLISILKLTSESELKASVLCHCMCEYICVWHCVYKWNVTQSCVLYICLLWGSQSHFPFLCPLSSSWPLPANQKAGFQSWRSYCWGFNLRFPALWHHILSVLRHIHTKDENYDERQKCITFFCCQWHYYILVW